MDAIKEPETSRKRFMTEVIVRIPVYTDSENQVAARDQAEALVRANLVDAAFEWGFVVHAPPPAQMWTQEDLDLPDESVLSGEARMIAIYSRCFSQGGPMTPFLEYAKDAQDTLNGLDDDARARAIAQFSKHGITLEPEQTSDEFRSAIQSSLWRAKTTRDRASRPITEHHLPPIRENDIGGVVQLSPGENPAKPGLVSRLKMKWALLKAWLLQRLD